jgi:hypothetical protein
MQEDMDHLKVLGWEDLFFYLTSCLWMTSCYFVMVPEGIHETQ